MAEARSESPRSATVLEVKSDREVLISRTFRAPPRIVFDAWTRPEFVRRWWAPRSCVEVVDIQADVRVGGAYRYQTRHDGRDTTFYGTYSEVTPHTRLAYTQIFDMFPDAAVLVTITFEERDGKTHLVSHEVYPSKEALEGALASGMEHGLRETMDQLDELVASLR
ncbi:SRPBCC family protein [Corallococcus sp. BB11-1]|uniref:SRPBCC family protein n=1 Tax=Corallococcus sp. BB11-1 TaxID=2996783 RepID=UPI0010EC93D4|nr:SRPBCC family protein [Corallococcus sp. BB11-1]MCY1035959.1 SRPBCC family protein [Corallococcus sp. BB11-1]RYZ47075.1 MAG: ATPase [Myxococcaceae bacterium]